MKKLFSIIAFLAATLTANAQFEAGQSYIGASLTNINLSYSGSSKTNLGLEATAGLFTSDDLLLYGQAGWQHKGADKFDDMRVAFGARYNIEQNGIFLGAKGILSHVAMPNYHFNDIRPAVEVGYTFFVSHEVAIEPAIYYEQSFRNHSDYSTIGFKVGFALYHKKDKVINSVKEAFK